MRTVPHDLLTALRAMLVFTVLCGILVPLVVFGVGQAAFSANANGQLVHYRGHLVGSNLIGQNFADPVLRHGRPVLAAGVPETTPDPRFFQTRPSGTTPADNDAATTFANYGPNSTITLQAIRANIAAYIALNGRYVPGGLTAAKVPVDAADTSASGVDPDISPANAALQAYRVAAVDHLPLARVRALIAANTGARGLGILGEPTVNVLELNLAIDRMIK
ncbi:potassium-transporting ATPase subunit C [Conexibacter sp. DBS9H8]|uniref:potassium-transporting ATPase subunit C n=1 Tax=Conexibacter sp. DBS9H8 TaxID=2937801 RepID=UPI00200DDF14|nr:potassium-transporting ATPase subunit C [Conexibacter sp. DBS9H8]